MNPTFADYVWFEERFPDLAEAYCFTYVRGLEPKDVLRRMGAVPERELVGVAALGRETWQNWDQHKGDRQLVGATAIGEWTLTVEVNGRLGVDEQSLVPLSRGTTVVSHSEDVNAVMSFYWVEDGTVRVTFDPLFAFHRDGTDADNLTEAMTHAGLDLRPRDEDPDEEPDFHGVSGAAFALAAHLTGVRLTPEIIENATYLCGLALA